MGDKTGIAWTDATWNCIRGCSRVSPGCEACYAEVVAGRFSGLDPNGKPLPYHGLVKIGKNGARWNGVVRPVPEHLEDPLRWSKPRRIFVNSMSDVFHEALPVEEIDKIMAVMLLSPRHTFQVLTKRAERMRDYLRDPGLYDRVLRAADPLRDARPELDGIGISDPFKFPAPWIWWGVSVEDQKRADERVPLLLQTPARVRFLSVEPLLGPVDLVQACDPTGYTPPQVQDGVRAELDGLSWVIIGGESGRGARACEVEWFEAIANTCRRAKVACFVKQDGGPRSGMKGRLPGWLWALKEFPA